MTAQVWSLLASHALMLIGGLFFGKAWRIRSEESGGSRWAQGWEDESAPAPPPAAVSPRRVVRRRARPEVFDDVRGLEPVEDADEPGVEDLDEPDGEPVVEWVEDDGTVIAPAAEGDEGDAEPVLCSECWSDHGEKVLVNDDGVHAYRFLCPLCQVGARIVSPVTAAPAPPPATKPARKPARKAGPAAAGARSGGPAAPRSRGPRQPTTR